MTEEHYQLLNEIGFDTLIEEQDAEFNATQHVRGTVSMARSANPDSANSQFFICFEDSSWLNGQYTVFGEVVDGMEHIDAITRGEPPAEPDQIISLTMAD